MEHGTRRFTAVIRTRSLRNSSEIIKRPLLTISVVFERGVSIANQMFAGQANYDLFRLRIKIKQAKFNV